MAMMEKLKVIDDFYRLTPADLKKGHKRIYDMNKIKNEFISTGFNIVHAGGILQMTSMETVG